MADDSLLSDDLPILLRQFPSERLRDLIEICKQSSSLSVFPAQRAREASELSDGGDFTKHADAIAQELAWWGSHDVWRQLGYLPTWREIVFDVAKKAGVDKGHRTESKAVWEVEQAVFAQSLANWDSLSPKERQQALKQAGANFASAWGGIAAGAGGLAALSGEQVIAAIAARGAGLAFSATAFAPVATILGVVWTLHQLAGAGFRVITPAVLIVARTRRQLRDARALAAFQD